MKHWIELNINGKRMFSIIDEKTNQNIVDFVEIVESFFGKTYLNVVLKNTEFNKKTEDTYAEFINAFPHEVSGIPPRHLTIEVNSDQYQNFINKLFGYEDISDISKELLELPSLVRKQLENKQKGLTEVETLNPSKKEVSGKSKGEEEKENKGSTSNTSNTISQEKPRSFVELLNSTDILDAGDQITILHQNRNVIEELRDYLLAIFDREFDIRNVQVEEDKYFGLSMLSSEYKILNAQLLSEGKTRDDSAEQTTKRRKTSNDDIPNDTMSLIPLNHSFFSTPSSPAKTVTEQPKDKAFKALQSATITTKGNNFEFLFMADNVSQGEVTNHYASLFEKFPEMNLNSDNSVLIILSDLEMFAMFDSDEVEELRGKANQAKYIL